MPLNQWLPRTSGAEIRANLLGAGVTVGQLVAADIDAETVLDPNQRRLLEQLAGAPETASGSGGADPELPP